MKVRCVRETLTAEETRHFGLKELSEALGGRLSFGVSAGVEYAVYGLIFSEGVRLQIADEKFENIFPVPLCLFEITDPRLPSLWAARVSSAGVLSLRPKPFLVYEDGLQGTVSYEEDLAESVPSAVAVFRYVREEINSN